MSIKSKIQTLATLNSTNLRLSMGDGYTTLSVGPAHTQSLMLKTDLLQELVDLVNHGKTVWGQAKEIEKTANSESAS